MNKAGKTSLIWGIVVLTLSLVLLIVGIVVRIEYNESYYYYYYSDNPTQLVLNNSNQAK